MRINFNLFGFEVQIERMGYDIHIIGFEDVRNRYVERFTVIHHTFTLRGALRTARRFAREYALEDECSQFIKIYREEERESDFPSGGKWILDVRSVTKVSRLLKKL